MVTLADIFRQHGPVYRRQFAQQILPSHKQAMQAIVDCRTVAMGGHVYACTTCGHTEYRYHSCRNRHCPQCQGDRAHEWLERQQEMLLPVPYYLLTFTLPAALRSLARSHQKLVYNLLFRASAAATQKMAQNPRFLGGAVGMIGVLHTWGRNLSYHPHVHYLVPAGAWDELLWRYGRSRRFLLPVRALSKLFRATFREALKKSDCFQRVPTAVWSQDWVVHCQPVGRGRRALRYLAPYIFRVALSNRRLVAMTDESVTFRYRPSGSREWRLCTVSAVEFLRRFLQHVLPKGFVKARYYGFSVPVSGRCCVRLRPGSRHRKQPNRHRPNCRRPQRHRCPIHARAARTAGSHCICHGGCHGAHSTGNRLDSSSTATLRPACSPFRARLFRAGCWSFCVFNASLL